MMLHETIPKKALATTRTHRFCRVMEGNQGIAQRVPDDEKPGEINYLKSWCAKAR